MSVQHVFFDLDKTLWDFDKNSAEVLADLYKETTEINSHISDFDAYLSCYQNINHQLWIDLASGKIDKAYLRKNRFYLTNLQFNIDNADLSMHLDQCYLERTPSKTGLIDFAKPVLKILHQRYQLHIITNGFDDVQHFKINNCGLHVYFKEVITSDSAQCCKPDKEIFKFALKQAAASPEQAIMIGDDLNNDIKGAQQAGFQTIYFNRNAAQPSSNDHHEINCLSELLEFL